MSGYQKKNSTQTVDFQNYYVETDHLVSHFLNVDYFIVNFPTFTHNSKK